MRGADINSVAKCPDGISRDPLGSCPRESVFLPVAALVSGIVARVHGAQRIFAKFPSLVSGAPKGEGVGEVGVRVRPVY